jgi:hypothetical protein
MISHKQHRVFPKRIILQSFVKENIYLKNFQLQSLVKGVKVFIIQDFNLEANELIVTKAQSQPQSKGGRSHPYAQRLAIIQKGAG